MPNEQHILAAQIGRPLRAESRVLRRCTLGLPVVVEVPPVLDTGEPFPTRYWLVCPLAHRRIARVEAQGGVREAEERALHDPAFADALAAAHRRYARERDALVPESASLKPRGGVGGVAKGVKCLHAHYADFYAGNDNPVGQSLADRVGRLDCLEPCVVTDQEGARRNPGWKEPR